MQKTKILYALFSLPITFHLFGCEGSETYSGNHAEEQGEEVSSIRSGGPPTFCGEYAKIKDRFSNPYDKTKCQELQDEYLTGASQWISFRYKEACCECYFPGSMCPTGDALNVTSSRCAPLNEKYKQEFEAAIARGTSVFRCPKPDGKDIGSCCRTESLSHVFNECKAQITSALPQLNRAETDAFVAAHRAEATNGYSPGHGTVDTGYQSSNDPLRATTLSLARPILESAAMTKLMSSDKLDTVLVKCALLATALPAGLEDFYKRGAEEKKLIDGLLADDQLMKQMMVAGGAKAGKYGKAMQILKSIQNSSERAGEGVFRRLAMAASLELAAPDLVGHYDTIDPVKRYKFYENSYVKGELIPAFPEFSTWLYRQVINDWSSEEDLDWLRAMAKNFRPDIVSRYSNGTELDHIYPLLNQQIDGDYYPPIQQIAVTVDESLPYTRTQQIFMHGGQCGAKAEIGRAMVRSFGVPSFGFQNPGHAEPGFWTPSGWRAVNVGFLAGYWVHDVEWIHTRTFWLEANARRAPDKFMQALRLEWISAVLGEEKGDPMWAGRGDLWSTLARNKKRAIIDDGNLPPWTNTRLPRRELTEADRIITTNTNGVITVPAAACYNTRSSKASTCAGEKIYIIETYDEPSEIVLHYTLLDDPQSFGYKVVAPQAGRYRLTADVVTVNMDQYFDVTVNGVGAPVSLELPYTVGRWQTSEPIEVTLVQGENTIVFSRGYDPSRVTYNEKYGMLLGYSSFCNTTISRHCGAITVKNFKLTPVL